MPNGNGYKRSTWDGSEGSRNDEDSRSTGQTGSNELGRTTGGGADQNRATNLNSVATSSTSTLYSSPALNDPLLGMRRRSSIVNDVNADNPLFSVPASRQRTSLVVPTSTASGSSLQAQIPLNYDPRSPVPRHLRPIATTAVPIPFQSTFLSTFDESETASGTTSESETPSVNSSPTILNKDGLMSMSAQDLRRPSFQRTVASNSSKPKFTSSKPPSFFRAIFAWFLSRRMLRILRMWLFALLALFLMIRSLDLVLPRVRNSPQLRELFEPPPPPIKDRLKEQMRQVAESVPRPIPRVERENFQKGSTGQVAFELAREKESPHINLEQVAQFRKQYLWRAPEEDAVVHFANPNKGQPHESTIIFVHGMRQRAAEAFLPVNMHKDYTSTRWVLPQANNRTVFTSQTTSELHPSWFDLSLPYDPASANGRLPHLFASVRILNQIIRAERALLILRRREALAGGPQWVSEGPRPGLVYTASHGPDADGRRAGPVPVEPGFLESFGTEEERRWASKRIVLAGFSQGSVVSLMTALSGEYPLGGVAVFSGFLPMRWELPKLMSDLETKDIPVFWGHGSDDKILTLNDAIASVNLMRHESLVDFFAPLKHLPANFTLPSAPPTSNNVGMSDVTFRVYPSLDHSWCHDEVRDLKQWISKIIPNGQEAVKNWS
ncbi:hypothetical protein JCM3765_004604 [Sporobolomyces pararoseus]